MITTARNRLKEKMVKYLPCLLPNSTFLQAAIALTGFAIEHAIEFVEIRRRAKDSERQTCDELLCPLESAST